MRLVRASVLLAGAGLALGVAGGVARGAGDPRAQAEAIVKQVEAVPAHKALAKDPLEQAHKALERAASARASGDQLHGGQLEALALEWAGTANDLVRATDAEAEATKIEKQIAESERKAVRARVLLEETLARRGRAQEKLDKLQKEAAKPTAPEAAAKPTAKGAKPAAPKAPAKPAKPAAPKAKGGTP